MSAETISVPFADIVVKDGDTVSIPIEITASSGGPLDLTTAEVVARVWVEGEETDIIAPFPLVPVDPPTAGIALLQLAPDDYAPLTPRSERYWYDVRVVNGRTILQGRFYFGPDRAR
jgi:hypothetical protein